MNKSNQDPVEQFVRQHRNALDAFDTPPGVWEVINSQLRPAHGGKGRILRFHPARWAAAAILLVAIGAGIGYWAASKAPMTPDPLYAEFREAETYYQSRISSSIQTLQSYDAMADIAPDLEEMNTFITDLKQELNHTPPAYREEVIRALIANYQAKVNLLEYIIEQIENQKSKPHANL